jgi:hypothetical protein
MRGAVNSLINCVKGLQEIGMLLANLTQNIIPPFRYKKEEVAGITVLVDYWRIL